MQIVTDMPNKRASFPQKKFLILNIYFCDKFLHYWEAAGAISKSQNLWKLSSIDKVNRGESGKIGRISENTWENLDWPAGAAADYRN